MAAIIHQSGDVGRKWGVHRVVQTQPQYIVCRVSINSSGPTYDPIACFWDESLAINFSEVMSYMDSAFVYEIEREGVV